MLKNSALPCYSANPIGGTTPLTHEESSAFPALGAFGPYRVMHQIGVGVLGPVFRTYHPDDDRLVALKAFQLDMTPEQADSLAAALNGIVQAEVVHPSLVTPLGAGLSDGVAYLAMEYVVAESLDVAIRQYAPGAVGTVLPFVVQLAEAIDTAHAGGLSHGALHLRDVFVTPELARVTGFGVVSALDRVRVRGPLRRPYTAPEQIAGAGWGPAADRFALAAIAYELLTGKRVAGTGQQVTDRLVEMAGVRDVPSVTRLFAGALADTPERRPASARVFADELAHAVGWTGADAVRQALVTMNGEAGDPERQVSDDVPVIAVAGVRAHLRVDVETIGAEGAALDMARTSKLNSTPASALDWTERTLDRGESDELREPEAYEPRPPGAPPGVERSGQVDRGAVPDFDRLDAVLDKTPDDTSVPADADADHTPSPVGSRVERRPGDGAAPPPNAGLLFDQVDEGDDVERHDGAAPVLVPEDDEADLSVIQARYRPPDDSAEPPSDVPDSRAAGVYEAITLSDRQDRLGDTAGLPEGDSDDDRDPGADLPSGPEAGDDGAAAPVNRTLLFESETEDDDDRYRHDDLQAGRVASGWADRVRGLPVVPLALIGVVLTVALFVVGFGWGTGGDDIVTDEPSSAAAVVAGGVADPADAPESGEPAPPLSRRFSEVTVGSSVDEAPVEVPVETLPTRPLLEPAPEEPAVPESAGRGVAVAATEVTGDLDPVSVPVLEPAPPRADGRLLVRSTPPGVRVVVNGETRGTTPLALGDLSYGAYDIRFSLEGYESQDHRLAISPDAPIAAVNAALARVVDTRTAALGVGSIYVDTRPPGVEVWLDQQLVGESPMLIRNVSTGAHEVEFRYAGYRDWAATVQVGSSAQARVTASLDHVPR